MLTDILEIFQINRPFGTDREVNLKVCENILSILSLYGHIKIACMLLVLFRKNIKVLTSLHCLHILNHRKFLCLSGFPSLVGLLTTSHHTGVRPENKERVS